MTKKDYRPIAMKNQTEQNTIPGTLKSLFDEIASRLWNRRASVMVGAGFSRNASPSFPLWNELGDAFFEKVNGRNPGPGDKAYQSIPRLAQQVECLFGRPALDRILQEQIPDESVNPSALHRRLLDLPWQDVFSTNYDTLLERAASQSRRHYTPVFDAQSLANAEKPRIVKLHGSFPAHRPFVITEEDYRQYPDNRAPFVNTVQQSLLENTLCLIGFSGDDPNFLQWIGWIRDRLGTQYTQRIYLIDCFGMDQPYRSLLAERRIEVVDLSLLPGIGRDCRTEALTRFVDYLSSQNPENTKWPGQPALLELHKKSADDAVRYLCPLLESIRTNCPCGFLLPREKRESLWFRLMQIPDSLFLNATDEDAFALRILHEVVWLFSKCLVPLEKEMADACEAVRKRYWPFDSSAPQEAVYRKDNTTFSVPWDGLRDRWLTLSLELFRYYREHGEKDAASRVLNELREHREHWSPVQEQWFWYENYLFSLSIFSVEAARKSLSFWPENKSLPYWAAKKAAAYAELGDLDQAKPRILEAVSCIRSQLNRATGPVVVDLCLAENYAIQLRQYIFSAAESKDRQFWNKKDADGQLPTDGKTENAPPQLKLERNEDRPPKGCYAEEMEMFRLLLDHDLRSKPEPTSQYGFDAGNILYRSSWSVTKLNEYSAQSMVRFLEVAGFPFKICDSVVLESNAFNNVLQKISETNMFSGVLLSVRAGATSLPEHVFDRKYIAAVSTEQADNLIKVYARTLERTLSALSGRIRSEYDPFDLRFLSALPEFLSRLCCKSSFESRTTIWRLVKNAYASPFRSRVSHMPELVHRLLHVQSIQETLDRIPFLLTIPQPTEWTPLDEMNYQNPLQEIRLPVDSIKEKTPTISSSEIVRLFEALSNASGPARKWTIRSLFVLWKIGALSKRQTKTFIDFVFSLETSEDSGLFALERMQLRYPSKSNDIDKSELMEKLDRLAKDSSKNVYDVLMTIQFVYCDFANYESMHKQHWTLDDGKAFLTRSIQDIWPKIEQGLKTVNTGIPLFNIGNAAKSAFHIFAIPVSLLGIGKIASGDIAEWKERLDAVFRTCDSFAIPCLELRAAWHVASGFDTHETATMIREALFSNQPEKIESALSAMTILFKQDRKTIGDCDLMELLRESILWCSGEAVHAVLHSLCSLFSRVEDAATTPIVSALDSRFQRLWVETDYRSGIPELPTELKIIIRQDVTRLCIWLALQKRDVTKTRLTCLSQWAALRDDENEFAEICVLWKNHPEICGSAVGQAEPTKNHPEIRDA